MLKKSLLNLILLAISCGVNAKESDTFTYPIVIEKPELYYPVMEKSKEKEGWVHLSYVVSDSGKPTDIIVEDSSGIVAFEKAAEKTLQKYRFKPAKLNGEPHPHYNNQIRMFFAIGKDSRGAGRRFYASYKKANQLIRDNKLNEAKEIVEKLKKRTKSTLYEDAYFWLLNAAYESRVGNIKAATNSLKKATIHDAFDITHPESRKKFKKRYRYEFKSFLPRDVFINALKQLFQLQYRQLLYRDAMHTFYLLESIVDDPIDVAEYGAKTEEIKDIFGDKYALKIDGEVGDRGFWFYRLLRRQFSFDDIDGSLKNLEIRCDRKMLSAEIKSGKAWKIPESFGRCNLYIHGTPGTEFSLYEHPIKRPK